MGGLPDVLFVIDVGYEKIAVLEAAKLGIPVVGIVDTNNSPDNIEYVVPGNDDSMRAIKLYTRLVADAILEGKETIVSGADEEGELIELDDETKAPAVKISTRKTASRAVEAEADTAAADTVEAEVVDAVADSVEVEAKTDAESAPAEASQAESDAETAPAEAPQAATEAVQEPAAEETPVKKAAPKKAAVKKAADKKPATKKAAVKKAASKD